MAHLVCKVSFDYRWPSGSITAFKAGPDRLTTRRECVEYAVAKGYGIDPDAKAKGGPVDPDKTYMIGKGDGPEHFMPAASGAIIPVGMAKDRTK